MKNRNLSLLFLVKKISLVLIVLMCTALLGNATNLNAKITGNRPEKPNTNDTIYPLQLSLSAHVYANGYNVSCFGFKDGSINLTVTGGVPPYIYTWSEGDSTEDISGLPAGYYKVDVMDADSNETEAEITLTQPNQLERLIVDGIVYKYPNGYNVSCSGCTDGSIDVSVSGGSGSYIYEWKDGPTTQDRSGLGAGDYSIVVRDTNVCSKDQTNMWFGLKEPEGSPMKLELTANEYPNGFNVSCFGFKDGSIDLTVSGGTIPYRYRWSEKDTTEDISNLAAGYYKVRVIDARNRFAEADINLTQPKPLPKPEISDTISEYPNGYNVSCSDCFNGSIDLTVTGGSGAFIYLWRDGSTTEDRTGLGGGDYSVVIIDTSECSNGDKIYLNFGLKEPSKDGWSMNGNEGTDPESQFLGTTDATDFVLKTNNVEQLRLSSSSDSTGMGRTKISGNGEVSNNFTVGNTLNIINTLKIDSLAGNGFKIDSLSTKSYRQVLVDETGKFLTFKNHAVDDPPGTDFVCGDASYGTWYLGGNKVGIDNNYADFIGTCNNWPFRIKTHGLERMRIDGNGNVGIGIYSPKTTLDLNGHFFIHDNTNAGVIYFPANGNFYFRSTDYPQVYDAANERMFIGGNGNVGIGTTLENNPNNYKLAVNGTIGALEVIIENSSSTWSDYVFDKNYKILSLLELEKYITKNKHLPDVPSANEVKEKGIKVAEMDATLLKKIEEQTIYIIDLQKQIDELKKQIEIIKKN